MPRSHKKTELKIRRHLAVPKKLSQENSIGDILADAKSALSTQMFKFKVSAGQEAWGAQECAAFKALVSSAVALDNYEKRAVDELELNKLSDEEIHELSQFATMTPKAPMSPPTPPPVTTYEHVQTFAELTAALPPPALSQGPIPEPDAPKKVDLFSLPSSTDFVPKDAGQKKGFSFTRDDDDEEIF